MLDIKRAIKDAGLTQREVSERLGITLTSLNQIMTGNPTYAKLKQVAFAIGIDTVDLFYDEGKIEELRPIVEKDIMCPKCGAKLELRLKKE